MNSAPGKIYVLPESGDFGLSACRFIQYCERQRPPMRTVKYVRPWLFGRDAITQLKDTSIPSVESSCPIAYGNSDENPLSLSDDSDLRKGERGLGCRNLPIMLVYDGLVSRDSNLGLLMNGGDTLTNVQYTQDSTELE